MITRLPEAGYVHAKMGCYLCNRPDDVIDTAMSIEGEGVLCICVRCVADLAFAAGMDPEAAGEVEIMAQLTARLTEERGAATKLNRKLRSDIRDLKADLAEVAEKLAQASMVADRVVDLELRLSKYDEHYGD